MAHHDNLIKEVLPALDELLPVLPERLEAVRREADTVQAAVQEFLRGIDERQTEATALFSRVEAALADLRRESDASLDLRVRVAAAADASDPAEVLSDPSLSFETMVGTFTMTMVERHTQDLEGMRLLWAKTQENEKIVLRAAADDLIRGVLNGGMRLDGAFEESVLEGAGLQGTVEAARETLATEMEQLASEAEALRAQNARDVETLVKDLASLEATLLTRLDRARDAIRLETDRVEDHTQSRLDDIVETVERALNGVGRANRGLQGLFKSMENESAETRRHITQPFEELNSHINRLKAAVESVRAAAREVGIPF